MTVAKHRGVEIVNPDAFMAEIARRDFMSFAILAYPHISGGSRLKMNWHLDALAHQLDQVVKGKTLRLLALMPPRNLKSIMISVLWVAWVLGRDPHHRFVCASYALPLAGKHASDCRTLMETAWYRSVFPGTIIKKGRGALYDFETTRGGGRLTTSVTGTLTGRGGDTIIIDDPIKPDEAMSEVTRDNTNEWFRTTLASRLNDKERGAIIIVMQRLHQYDLPGMLLERGGWTAFSMPAIAEQDEIIRLQRGRTHRRREGDVLHPAHEGLAALMRQKHDMGSANFAAQYQQKPVPAEGNIVKAKWLIPYAELPETGRIVQSWDTASKEGVLNDYSVCITAWVDGQRVYVIDVMRAKLEYYKVRQSSIDLARQHQAKVILIEDASSGQALISSLRHEEPQGVVLPTARRPVGDKVTRMSAASAMIERGQLMLPANAPWLAEFKHEVLGFPSVPKDDQVDALSQLLLWVDEQQAFQPLPMVGPTAFFGDGQGGCREVGPDGERPYEE